MLKRITESNTKMSYQIIRDNVQPIVEGVVLSISAMWSIKDAEPRHKVSITGDRKSIKNIENQLFGVDTTGRFEVNAIGKKYGARLGSSSHSIEVNGNNLRQLANELKIDTVYIIRHATY